MLEHIDEYITIPKNHHLTLNDGIYTIVSDSFKDRLTNYLDRFLEIQKKEDHPILPTALYEQFPFVDFNGYKSEIFTRKQDLSILNSFFSTYLNSQHKALEIGGWNSWLTNFLSKKGIETISADIFSDEINGLKSKKYFKENNWISIETDITKVDIYKTKFDIIVLNHCLQFYPNPLQLIESYKSLLKKNGVLLILGNTFYKHTRGKENEVSHFRSLYKTKHQFEIQFYPSKGYFSYTDYNTFVQKGFKFLSYQFSFLGGIRKKFKQEKSGILYFINH